MDNIKKKILVIAAHPDDEVLGCGGTLIKLAKSNDIFLAFAANGVSGHKIKTKNEITKRRKAMLKVAKILGATVVSKHYRFTDQELDKENFNNIVSWIEQIITSISPDAIYTHWPHDLNRDHRVLSEAVTVACRPQNSLIKEIYWFELAENSHEGGLFQETTFNPNFYEKIDLKEKLELLKIYSTEMNRSDKWLIGTEILSLYRGFNAGLSNAEAFILIRKRVE